MQQRDLKALLIINPGNPTGQFIPLEEMIDFLHQARGLELVIVDESFIDFAGDPVPSLLPVADQFTNLLLVRSMSKHCGVPGLRLGYCYSGNLYLLNRLRRLLPTWNLNTVAQYFLSLLPGTDADYHQARKRLMGDVHWLYGALQSLSGLTVYPTGANFVLCKDYRRPHRCGVAGQSAARPQDVCAGLLQQSWHGQLPHRIASQTRKRLQAGASVAGTVLDELARRPGRQPQDHP